MKSETIRLAPAEVENLAARALIACGTTPENAQPVAAAFRGAEADGITSHGLARLPMFCDQVRSGKISGGAKPLLSQPRPGVVRVDAADGFAHRPISIGMAPLVAAARVNGVASLAIANAYSAHVLGHHVERLAEHGLLGIGFTIAPASIAPAGGRRAVFGTNPIALALPRAGAPPLVVDQSSSVVAKSEVVDHNLRGEPIPLGWALDRDGRPTTSAKAALEGGTMAPAGGYKGVNLALIVEAFAALMTGSNLSIEAPPYADNKSRPMRLGHFFVAFDPGDTEGWAARVEALVRAITEQEGAHLPGDRRLAARRRATTEGIAVPRALHERIVGYTI